MTTHNFVKQTVLLGVLGVLVTAPMAAVERGKIFIGGRATVISEPGSYVLGSPISLSENSIPAAAIMITADNVTLDLNGQRITGPGIIPRGVGVMVAGASSVTVRNGHIADMFVGVQIMGSNNVRLNDLHISGQDIPVSAPPPEIGVMIAQSQNVEVEDVNISKTGLGIFVRGGMSTGNRIANNTVTAGSNGIFAICYNPTPDDPMGPRGDTITGNLLSGYSTGVSLVSTSGNNVFWGNTIVFKNSAWESLNATNLFQDNVEMQLP